MKPFKDYETTQTYKQRPQLPVGGYILKVKDARIDNENTQYEKLVIFFDIEEGPFRNFYADDYRSQTGEDKKWKGAFRLWTPKDDGSEQDDWAKRRFKTVMETFEECNEGFHWDWDEKKLKNLTVGGVFNRKEYEFNGRRGFFTQCKYLTSVDAIEKNTFKQPADDYLKDASPAADQADEFMKVSDSLIEDLPFQ